MAFQSIFSVGQCMGGRRTEAGATIINIITGYKIDTADGAAIDICNTLADAPIEDLRAGGSIKVAAQQVLHECFVGEFRRFYHDISAERIGKSAFVMIVICCKGE